jgi:hypothetical protein
VDASLAGLLGAIIGGGLTAGSTYIAETQRIREVRRERSTSDTKEYTQAARLVVEELLDTLFTADEALESCEWWPTDYVLRHSTWDTYAPVLALGDDNVWGWVAGAYEVVFQMNRHVARYRDAGQQPPWEREMAWRVRAMAGSVTDAMNGLRETMGLHEIGGATIREGHRPGQMSLSMEADDVFNRGAGP